MAIRDKSTQPSRGHTHSAGAKPAGDPRVGAQSARDKPTGDPRVGAQSARNKPTGDKAFTGAIPEIYDRYMVPMLFEPYAQHIAARAATCGPADVLEVAAGTGVVTRELARHLPEARIVATDLNQEMVDYAAKKIGDARIAWRQADAMALPFADASFDTVVCQFGAMFFPDKVAGFREARRVLRPRGAYLFNTWDRIEANGFAQEAIWGLCVLCPDNPPQFLRRTPHSYYDEDVIRGHLRDAGFTDVTIAAVEHRCYAANPRIVAIAMCQGTPMRLEIEARGLDLEEATNAVAAAIANRYGVGEVEGTIRALVVEAR